MASIPITGVPSTYRVPGQYAEILFAQGPSTASAGERECILVMPKLAASGSWTADTVYRVRNEQELIDGAGEGSPLHRAGRMFLRANKTAKLWALPYLPSSGAGLVSAAGTVTYTTNASATGVTSVTVAGETASVSFVSGDTPTIIAAAMAAAINAKAHLPVTASPAAGVVTLTAKIGGASQGDGTTGVIRLRAEIDTGVGTTVATSGAALGLGTGTAGVDGSTAEEANLLAALNTITASRYYYMGISVWTATPVGHLTTHIATKSEPRPGLRSVGVLGYTGTLASGQTLATGENSERMMVVWQPNSEHDNAELTGAMLAVRHKRESADSAASFDGYREADWLVKPAYAEADWPDDTDLNDAINDGLTPISSSQAGSSIVMAVTTRSKNSAGTQDDFRAAEPHRVSVADEYTDTLLARWANSFGRKKLRADQTLTSGAVNTNQRLGPGVVTPHTSRAFVKRVIQEFADSEKIQSADASKESLRVVRDPNNSGRLEIGHDLHVIDLLHQATFRLAEVSSG